MVKRRALDLLERNTRQPRGPLWNPLWRPFPKSYLLAAAISAIHLEWARAPSLRVERGAEADVVSWHGAYERGVGQTGEHVEGSGQHRGVCGDPQRTLNWNFLMDLVPAGDLVIQPLCHQVLKAKSVTVD